MHHAKPHHSKYYKREALAFYILILPFIIMLFAARIFPVGWSFYMSLTNFTGWNLERIPVKLSSPAKRCGRASPGLE